MTARARKAITDRLNGAEAFTSAEVARATGITLRQLQWWDEKGYIKPIYGQIAHVRLYSKKQVETIKQMVKLRKAGVSLRCLRECLGISGWTNVIILRKSAVLVGDTLVVRKALPPEPKPREKKSRNKYSSADLDRMAFRDPLIAQGRHA